MTLVKVWSSLLIVICPFRRISLSLSLSVDWVVTEEREDRVLMVLYNEKLFNFQHFKSNAIEN
jgi:hypothetical protein